MISPSPRTPATDRRAGFSLIEVVAVMLIIALVASLAVTTMPGTGRGRLKALTLETAALLRRERLGAVMTGRERQVSVDGEQRVLIGDGGDVVAVPRGVVTRCSTDTKHNAPVPPVFIVTSAMLEVRVISSPTRSGSRNSSSPPAHIRRGSGTGGRKPPRAGWPSGPSSDIG